MWPWYCITQYKSLTSSAELDFCQDRRLAVVRMKMIVWGNMEDYDSQSSCFETLEVVSLALWWCAKTVLYLRTMGHLYVLKVRRLFPFLCDSVKGLDLGSLFRLA